MVHHPEAFSRILIDRALADSNWDLLNPQQVRFEVHGSSGRADYVLCGSRGPLCVLEAKKEDEDPYDAKEQARGYAENLRVPVVILNEVLKLENEIVRRGNELLKTLGGQK